MTQKQGGREVSDAAIRTYVLQQQVAATFWGQFGTCSHNDRGPGENPISRVPYTGGGGLSWCLDRPIERASSILRFEYLGHDKGES
jgi:hypothetical protein